MSARLVTVTPSDLPLKHTLYIVVRFCNVVATSEYSRPQCNVNLYNNQYDHLQSMGGLCYVVAIGRVDRRMATPWCHHVEE
jgi:hypothetical protein